MSYYMFNAQNNSGMSLQNYTYVKFNAMTQSQVEQLTSTQLILQSNKYIGSIVIQLLGSTQIGYLTSTQIQQLTSSQLNLTNSNTNSILVTNFSTTQLGWLTSTQIQNLSTCPIKSSNLNQFSVNTVSLYYNNLPTDPKNTLTQILPLWPYKYSVWPTTQTIRLLRLKFIDVDPNFNVIVTIQGSTSFTPVNFTSPFTFNSDQFSISEPYFKIVTSPLLVVDSNNTTNSIIFNTNNINVYTGVINLPSKSYSSLTVSYNITITLNKTSGLTDYTIIYNTGSATTNFSTDFIVPPKLAQPSWTIGGDLTGEPWPLTITCDPNTNNLTSTLGYEYTMYALSNPASHYEKETHIFTYSSNNTQILQLPSIVNIAQNIFQQDYHDFIFQYIIKAIYYNIPALSSLSSDPVDLFPGIATYYASIPPIPTIMGVSFNDTTGNTTITFNQVTGAIQYNFNIYSNVSPHGNYSGSFPASFDNNIISYQYPTLGYDYGYHYFCTLTATNKMGTSSPSTVTFIPYGTN
jgi:hypothetical protein